MALKCSFLNEKTPLVGTDNKLLGDGSNLTCQRNLLQTPLKRKRHLTSTECLNSKLFPMSKKLANPPLKNNFLLSDLVRCEKIGIFTSLGEREREREEESYEVSPIRRRKRKMKRSAAPNCYSQYQPLSAGFCSVESDNEEFATRCYMLGSEIDEPFESRIFDQAEFLQSDESSYFGSSMPKTSYCFSPPSTRMPRTSYPLFPTNEMPVYNFEPSYSRIYKELDFNSAENDVEVQLGYKMKEIKAIKVCFLNVVTTSLLYSPKFKKPDDSFRLLLLKHLDEVASVDPEFILKVALYARQELNIRSTANFLLAYSANDKNCRVYLKKYFSSSVRLPTDWIDVANNFSVFNKSLKPGFLPSALRKVMKSTFPQFDKYQLAKHNKKISRKPKKKGKNQTTEKESVTEDGSRNDKSYSLKSLIRLLHISHPTEEVMCLLGKKYPTNPEDFRQFGLPGIWNSEKSGKRMKLPVPETWETMVAAKGNKAEVWESLIDNRKLPYMAMLRNLRSMIMSGISTEHHKKVQSFMTKKEAVVKSRQFPLRFYAAFKTIENMQSLVNDEPKSRKVTSDTPFWKKKQIQKLEEKIQEVDLHILDSYKNSINQAIEISADHNMNPIAGKTLIICDLIDNTTSATGEVASYFSKKFHSCIMLALMCLKACEECEIKAVLSNNSFEAIKMKSKSFLKNMSDICSKYEYKEKDSDESSSDTLVFSPEEIFSEQLPELLKYYLRSDVILSEKLDNIIFIISSENFDNTGGKEIMEDFLHKYRHLVNPDLLYIQTDLSPGDKRVVSYPESYENDIYLRGFSEHIFKFIAERGSSGQVSYIDNIDKKYDLLKVQDFGSLSTSCNLPTITQNYSLFTSPSWKTVKVFISSTFKDMHGERDLLLRYVFPELKARASALCININEIDLRWGITEEVSSSKRCAELCLKEVQDCDFFIGILGERYGTRYTFDMPEDPNLDWVKSYSTKASITELEMHCGALKDPAAKRERAFFFIRDNSFISKVHPLYVDWFEAEDSDSKQRLDELKSKIRRNGFEIFDGYPCHWAGVVVKEKPIVGGLDDFGKRVLNNLWNALSKLHKKEEFEDEVAEELACHHSQAALHNFFVGEKNTPQTWLLGELKNENGIFLVTGKPGCGKTAFIVNLLKNVKGDPVIQYFVGSSPRSTNLNYMLYCIALSIIESLPVKFVLPKNKEALQNNFSDIIAEGAKVSSSGSLIIVIDGLDFLDSEAQTLDWLPYDLPAGIKLLCSASDSTTAYKTISNRGRYGTPVHFVPLKPLIVSDRHKLVQHYLKQHGKTLDENTFNNQMLQLVTKGDGGNPLYLHLACDYLRTFALFENLMNILRTFPSMINPVLEMVIAEMEKCHGKSIVQTALNLMCISREGLEENQLHVLLSLSELENSKDMSSSFEEIVSKTLPIKLQDMIPPISFRSLVHMLKTFACPYGTLSYGTLRLASTEFSAVVKKYYHSNDSGKKMKNWHMLLAAYYMMQCDPTHNKMWIGQSGAAFRNLPYHLFHGRCYKRLKENLCSLFYIQSCFEMKAADEILEYYVALMKLRASIQSSIELNIMDFQNLEDYHAFVSKNMHILKIYPFLVHQLGLNENENTFVYKSSSTCNIESGSLRFQTCMMKCLTKPPFSACLTQTLDGFLKDVTCIKSHPTDSIAVLGSDDGDVKILNVETGKILTSLKGHSSKITAACFIGLDKICTASADTTLSIWSYSDNCRIAVLKGHSQYVSSCCADLQNDIVSVGWDRSIRFWSSRDGREISCINKLSCPINSVCHHPTQQQIACGLWNGNVEIWNTMSLGRDHVLNGNWGSVRCVTYSPDGLGIISSTINGSVLAWSSTEHLKFPKIESHTFAVNCISCCTEGNVVVAGSDDTTLKVWPNQQQLDTLTNIDEFKSVRVNFMEIVSELHLAVAFQNNTICVFHITNGHVVSKFDTSSDPALCFSKRNEICDSKYARTSLTLLFGTQSGKIMMLNFKNSSTTLLTSIDVSIVVMHDTEHFIICGAKDGGIALYSYDDNQLFVDHEAHANSITALSVCTVRLPPLVLTTSSDKMIKLWKCDSGKLELLDTYLSKHQDHVSSCFLSRQHHAREKDDPVIITGSYDSSIFVRYNEKELQLSGLDTSVSSLFYTGDFFLACGRDGSIAVWTEKGKLVSCTLGIEQSSSIFTIDLRKGKLNGYDATLAYVEIDGSILVKKPFQHLPLCTLQGHSKKVTSCDINSKNIILSCSLDKTVNIWKIPSEMEATKIYHPGKISSVSLSSCMDQVLSGDVYGNLILWKINTEEKQEPLSYVTQNKCDGVINSILWISENTFACAVALHLGSEEKYVVEILGYESSPNSPDSSSIMYMLKQHCFPSEVTSIDYDKMSKVLVVGVKSGIVYLIGSQMQKEIPLVKDGWILHVKLFLSTNQTLCYADSNGSVGFIPYSSSKDKLAADFLKTRTVESEKPPMPSWITALNCDDNGVYYVGDSSGNITILKENDSIRKQAHTASVTSICSIRTHLFTSSLDKTLKVWSCSDMNQIGLFHCSVPISCLAIPNETSNSSSPKQLHLVLGTTVGDVHLLSWVPPFDFWSDPRNVSSDTPETTLSSSGAPQTALPSSTPQTGIPSTYPMDLSSRMPQTASFGHLILPTS